MHRLVSGAVPSVLWHCWLGVGKNIRPVRAEWLQSLSSIKTDFRCTKMMISFNYTIIKGSKSMYTSFCESYRSLDHRSTLSHYSRPISCLPLATTLIHYLSLSSVLPDCRRARVFRALPGRAHACPLPGANNAPPQRQQS